MLTPITDFSLRSSSPNIVQTQENANEKTSSRADAGEHADHAAVGPEAQDQPDRHDHRRGRAM